MSRALQNFQKRKILRIIDRWCGKLTWTLLCAKIQANVGIIITRQTLANYPSILHTYQQKKKEIRNLQEKKPTSDSALYNENLALKAKKERLEKDINYLIEEYLTLLANVNGGAQIIQKEFFFSQE